MNREHLYMSCVCVSVCMCEMEVSDAFLREQWIVGVENNEEETAMTASFVNPPKILSN